MYALKSELIIGGLRLNAIRTFSGNLLHTNAFFSAHRNTCVGQILHNLRNVQPGGVTLGCGKWEGQPGNYVKTIEECVNAHIKLI